MFKILKKSFWSALIALILIFIIYAMVKEFSQGQEPEWGVTFSSLYARELGLDPKLVYEAILDDLQIKYLRLIVYWPQVESRRGRFDWAEIDKQVIAAAQNGAQVILVVGHRVPRWPECHLPLWAQKLSQDEFDERVQILIRKTVEHFRVYSHITAWQVNNEPFLKTFGKCAEITNQQMVKYIELVRQADNQDRPIILTESGELSTWVRSAKLADIIGTSLYRTVWNKYFGYWHYPWPPAFYRWHADWIMKYYPVKEVIITELQAEPWPRGTHIVATSLADQFQSFDLEQLIKNVKYVRRTGFSEVYFWGVEWWYWLKEHGHPEFWEYLKGLNN